MWGQRCARPRAHRAALVSEECRERGGVGQEERVDGGVASADCRKVTPPPPTKTVSGRICKDAVPIMLGLSALKEKSRQFLVGCRLPSENCSNAGKRLRLHQHILNNKDFPPQKTRLCSRRHLPYILSIDVGDFYG